MHKRCTILRVWPPYVYEEDQQLLWQSSFIVILCHTSLTSELTEPCYCPPNLKPFHQRTFVFWWKHQPSPNSVSSDDPNSRSQMLLEAFEIEHWLHEYFRLQRRIEHWQLLIPARENHRMLKTFTFSHPPKRSTGPSLLRLPQTLPVEFPPQI